MRSSNSAHALARLRQKSFYTNPLRRRNPAGQTRALWLLGAVVVLGTVLAMASPRRSQAAAAEPQSTVASKVPWDQLAPEARRKAQTIIDNAALYRRMPTQVFPCDPEVYLFLINHPDVTTAVWRALAMSKLKIQRTSDDQFTGGDGNGTHGGCEFLYRSPGLHVFVCEGTYQAALMPKPIEASVLLVLQSAYFREVQPLTTPRQMGNAAPSGYVAHRLETYVQLDSKSAEVLAQLSSPLTMHVADRTFRDVSAFLAAMSRWMGTHTEWAYELSDRLDNVAGADREEFRALVDTVSERRNAVTIEPAAPPALKTLR